jgi:hypothetical protein
MASAIFLKTLGLKLWLSRRSEVRRGEKVPLAFGTVADRFVELEDLSCFERERSVVVVDAAARAALRARLVVGECLGFRVQERGNHAFRQASGNNGSESLHIREVHLLVGSDLVRSTLTSDFPPADGQLAKLTKKLR